jgi:hypothetical protein
VHGKAPDSSLEPLAEGKIMKPLSATLLMFAMLLTAFSAKALSPVYTPQKAKPNTASRITLAANY